MLYLIHISECIERYVGDGGKDELMGSTLTQDAMLRNLQPKAERRREGIGVQQG